MASTALRWFQGAGRSRDGGGGGGAGAGRAGQEGWDDGWTAELGVLAPVSLLRSPSFVVSYIGIYIFRCVCICIWMRAHCCWTPTGPQLLGDQASSYRVFILAALCSISQFQLPWTILFRYCHSQRYSLLYFPPQTTKPFPKSILLPPNLPRCCKSSFTHCIQPEQETFKDKNINDKWLKRNGSQLKGTR